MLLDWTPSHFDIFENIKKSCILRTMFIAHPWTKTTSAMMSSALASSLSKSVPPKQTFRFSTFFINFFKDAALSINRNVVSPFLILFRWSLNFKWSRRTSLFALQLPSRWTPLTSLALTM